MQATAKARITTAIDTNGGFSGILAQSPPAGLLLPRAVSDFSLVLEPVNRDRTCWHERDPILNVAGLATALTRHHGPSSKCR
jgi:hypothetical protein